MNKKHIGIPRYMFVVTSGHDPFTSPEKKMKKSSVLQIKLCYNFPLQIAHMCANTNAHAF